MHDLTIRFKLDNQGQKKVLVSVYNHISLSLFTILGSVEYFFLILNGMGASSYTGHLLRSECNIYLHFYRMP